MPVRLAQLSVRLLIVVRFVLEDSESDSVPQGLLQVVRPGCAFHSQAPKVQSARCKWASLCILQAVTLDRFQLRELSCRPLPAFPLLLSHDRDSPRSLRPRLVTVASPMGHL